MEQPKLQAQIDKASQDAGKILIIGAGLGGLTLAALLRQRGLNPVVIEKAPEAEFNGSGYMLGMMPVGGRALNVLNARPDYLARSLPMDYYKVYNEKGKCLQTYDMQPIFEQFGDYQGISRPELVNLLLDNFPGSDIVFNTTVQSLEPSSQPQVTFSNGTTATFDLVVAADGIHSPTRQMILNEQEYKYYQTNWGGWVTWIDQQSDKIQEYREYWNTGSFLGFYPVKEKIGVFLGGPLKKVKEAGPASVAKTLQAKLQLADDLVKEGLDAFKKADDFYFWDFHDCRSYTWRKGHVLLLGDAADGFLPTAGIGASMAMDSAVALNEELSKTDESHLSIALDLYEKRQRPRVEKAQANSRQLGKYMFMESKLLASLRNALLPYYSMDQFLKDIEAVLKGD